MSHNFHEDLSRQPIVHGSSDRSLGFALTIFLFVVGMWPLLRKHSIRVWPLLILGAVLFMTMVRPALLNPLTRASTALGLLLSRITNPIVTTALFIVVFVPMGCVARLRGRDLLHLDRTCDPISYWIPRTPPGPRPETMSKQF